MDFIANVLISVITGVMSSFFVWWYLFHKVVPKIEFGPNICKSPSIDSPNGFVYRFKYENRGNRDIIDVEFVIRLRLKGHIVAKPKLTEYLYFTTDSGLNNRVPVIPPFSRKKSRFISHINFINCPSFIKSKFPEEITSQAKEGILLLEDVLRLGTTQELQVFLFGNDAFSGTRKLFTSKKYTYQDIVLGRFNPNGLDVIPDMHQLPIEE